MPKKTLSTIPNRMAILTKSSIASARQSFAIALVSFATYHLGTVLWILAANISKHALSADWDVYGLIQKLNYHRVEDSDSAYHSTILRLTSSSLLDIAITLSSIAIGSGTGAIFSWIRKKAAVAKAGSPKPKKNPEDLTTFNRQDQIKIRDLKEECRSQKDRLTKLEKQLIKANSDLTKNTSVITKLEQQVQGQKANINGLHKRDAGQKATIFKLQGSLVSVNASFKTALIELEEARTSKTDLHIENEMLKCTAMTTKPSKILMNADFSAFATPFVVVLVDGDAYTWSLSHFVQTKVPAGAHAAQAIKTEVQRHLFENKDRVSLHSKIVTRVFQNEDGVKGLEIRTGRYVYGKMSEFAKSFTESMPLFDYMNCGRGKERADSKIHETVHLFIANPHCHTIFLAAATDNGFARLLEQYACVDAAKEKVILVHPGYVLPQIASLGYTAVEWPCVFQKRKMPPAAQKTASRMEQGRIKGENEMVIAAIRTIVEGVTGLGAFQVRSSHTSVGLKVGKVGDITKSLSGQPNADLLSHVDGELD